MHSLEMRGFPSAGCWLGAKWRFASGDAQALHCGVILAVVSTRGRILRYRSCFGNYNPCTKQRKQMCLVQETKHTPGRLWHDVLSTRAFSDKQIIGNLSQSCLRRGQSSWCPYSCIRCTIDPLLHHPLSWAIYFDHTVNLWATQIISDSTSPWNTG